MIQIFGDFLEVLPEHRENLILIFPPNSIALGKNWRNNSVSANFIANFLSNLLSEDDTRFSAEEKSDIKGSVSYIANEMLENAMKFSDKTSFQPISIKIYSYDRKVVLLTTNSITDQAMEKFRVFINELTKSDPEDLYLERLESSALDENSLYSQLGLLTILNDYTAKLGWKFESSPNHPGLVSVVTMVQFMF